MDEKQVKDPIHGYITIESELVDNIVDTHLFQRLRNLRQMDTTREVYPSANHTRFEHTLGVFHLAKNAFGQIRSDHEFQTLSEETLEEMEKTIKCASLCHDIGHFPLSHLGEEFCDESEIEQRLEEIEPDLRNEFQRVNIEPAINEAAAHELMSCLIVLSEYRGVIEHMGVDPIEACAFILGETTNDEWQWQVTADLLHSQIDVDRLDYMVRDNFMAGASLVAVDSNRMINAYTTADCTLALSEKAHSTIGNYLQGRNAVYLWVAQHHKVVYSNVVVEELIRELAEIETSEGPTDEGSDGRSNGPRNPLFEVDDIIDYGADDSYILEKIRSKALGEGDEYFENLYKKYRSRDFLGSCWKHVVDYNDKIESDRKQSLLLSSVQESNMAIRNDLMNEFDLEKHEVLVGESYVPGYRRQELNEIYVDDNGTAKRITTLDLYDTREELFRSIPFVFVPREKISSVLSYMKDEYPPVPGA